MPRSYLMTPDFGGRQKRWKKMVKGTVHTVTCADLRLPEDQWTELGSYRAANEWWTAKQQELEKAPLRRKLDALDDRLEAMSLDTIRHEQEFLERIKPQRYAAKPKGRKLGPSLDQWAGIVRKHASPASVVSLNGYVRWFKGLRVGDQTILADDMPLAEINSDKLIDVYEAIDRLKDAAGTKKKYWDTFRSFVTFAAESEWMTLPKNIRNKRFVFPTRVREKELPDLGVVRTFLDTLPDRLRLYALLALNCGMNNIDIGKLPRKAIDLDLNQA